MSTRPLTNSYPPCFFRPATEAPEPGRPGRSGSGGRGAREGAGIRRGSRRGRGANVVIDRFVLILALLPATITPHRPAQSGVLKQHAERPSSVPDPVPCQSGCTHEGLVFRPCARPAHGEARIPDSTRCCALSGNRIFHAVKRLSEPDLLQEKQMLHHQYIEQQSGFTHLQ